MLEALSWMGRGALELKQLQKADAYARETEGLVAGVLKHRALDSDPAPLVCIEEPETGLHRMP